VTRTTNSSSRTNIMMRMDCQILRILLPMTQCKQTMRRHLLWCIHLRSSMPNANHRLLCFRQRCKRNHLPCDDMLIAVGPHSTHSACIGRKDQLRSQSVRAQHRCLHEAAPSSSRRHLSHGDPALQHIGTVCVSLSLVSCVRKLTTTVPSPLFTVSTTSRHH
jgi:hypothetical protein